MGVKAFQTRCPTQCVERLEHLLAYRQGSMLVVRMQWNPKGVAQAALRHMLLEVCRADGDSEAHLGGYKQSYN